MIGRRRYDVSGRAVLVTGGARGIGFEAARRLGERGARLALLDRDADAVERAASELAAGGAEAEPFVADVGDHGAVADAIGAARARFGPVDVAIANAGIGPTPRPARSIPQDEFERVIAVNLLGVWNTLSAVLGDVADRRGYLLPIASLAAAVPVPLGIAYGASKAGVHSMARTLRMELASSGARVGCGYFSFIDTDMVRDAFADPLVQRSSRALPSFFSRPAPVGAAGAAIARGVERRANRVVAPRWVSGAIVLGGLGGPLEALAARDPRLVRTLRGVTPEVSGSETEGARR